jgi:hypothetical protein
MKKANMMLISTLAAIGAVTLVGVNIANGEALNNGVKAADGASSKSIVIDANNVSNTEINGGTWTWSRCSVSGSNVSMNNKGYVVSQYSQYRYTSISITGSTGSFDVTGYYDDGSEGIDSLSSKNLGTLTSGSSSIDFAGVTDQDFLAFVKIGNTSGAALSFSALTFNFKC